MAQSAPSDAASTRNAVASSDAADVQGDPLDQLSSADIALSTARMTGLAEVSGVKSQADSVNAELSVPPVYTAVISKPQTVATDLKSGKDIQTYVVVSGDNVPGIAAKFNVTSDSIKWSNNLTSDAVNPGLSLLIPPVNGIVYTVKAGDNPDTLAAKYKANKEQIIAYNDAEINGLTTGQQIIIPNGQQPAPPRAAYGSGGSGSYSFSFGSAGYNGYDRGFCTWYVANRRAEIGRPIPGGLGNASTWHIRAPAAGFTVNRTPAYGAAAVTAFRGAGHVVFVEEVNADGSIWVSEMNSSGQVSKTNTARAGGWGKVDWKLFPAEKASTFYYIH
ncbi:MAG TPA: CHAP domain-containing protein [Candidatus Saccharimonadales bacterium]|nr:CHAP domain-containing protein [Candidatus Saccharimonadales bacterium]